MLLVLDMGNTHITVGVYDSDQLCFEARIATDRAKTGDQYAVELSALLQLKGTTGAAFDGAIVSSVVPSLDHAMIAAVKQVTGIDPLFVGPGIKTGLNIRIDNPAQLGADLLVGAVAAVEHYGAPCIIWDLGTATTVFAVDKNGDFRGGAIMAGVYTAYESLAAHTSLLPNIRLEAPAKVIGPNTVASMQSGAVFGNAAMIDGMTDRILDELGVTRR